VLMNLLLRGCDPNAGYVCMSSGCAKKRSVRGDGGGAGVGKRRGASWKRCGGGPAGSAAAALCYGRASYAPYRASSSSSFSSSSSSS